MVSLRTAWAIQKRVIGALMLREITTRFGRENIGFLWIMGEPLLFAILVGIMWSLLHGSKEHGVSVMAFVVSGYIPLTMFRHAVSKSIALFVANNSLMYHRQIGIYDFIFVRFLIEMIGSMMAYLFVGLVLFILDYFPMPADFGLLIFGWLLYSFITLSLCLIIAPLSEMSEVLEKFMPVVTYIMIPFSGTFNMASWLSPEVREVLLYSPFVTAMELMRAGLFGDLVTPYYNMPVAIGAPIVFTVIGFALCRRIRRHLVVE
ncbi:MULTISPECIES: ABC transporter permease [unclassified Novosphingobium]|uniref:ABC transporter permease n=1 Tax=unclassified Novosphingobium TaxID=2644732 RepID=UPI00146E11C3|nr:MULTISPECIES: ABC transporter permease [unclassified Novosphingobium]NMN03191.1 capsular polysaccharide transport system permease protein [Novosphingobium sp. SG919]NMN86819.1 capsular polysaccharide transport system permease protein [Novosphingobium sp. SG916]